MHSSIERVVDIKSLGELIERCVGFLERRRRRCGNNAHFGKLGEQPANLLGNGLGKPSVFTLLGQIFECQNRDRNVLSPRIEQESIDGEGSNDKRKNGNCYVAKFPAHTRSLHRPTAICIAHRISRKFYACDEAIPAPRLGDDEAMVFGCFTEDLAEHGNILAEVVLLDDDVRPHGVHQVGFGHRFAGVLDEAKQGVKYLGFQRNGGRAVRAG